MSRSIVRRLTAAVAVVTVLCFAMPAGAAAPQRSQSDRLAVTLGSGLFEQFLSWLGFWFGQEPGEKSTAVTPTETGGSEQEDAPGTDRGAQIDPNG